MEFKIGKTCSGCERIVKNMKKLGDNKKIADTIEDKFEGNGLKNDVSKFLNKTTEESKEISKQLAKKLKDNAKIKTPKIK